MIVCIKFRQDYGVRSLESVLDIVKVMDFALQNGKVCYFQTISISVLKNNFHQAVAQHRTSYVIIQGVHGQKRVAPPPTKNGLPGS